MAAKGGTKRVLVAYASTHGHTAKIAGRVAEAVRTAGLEAEVEQLGEAADPDPGAYDGVIAGASLHQGKHQPELVEWVRAHREALESRPAGFFSVSLTAAEDTEEARAATQECLDGFLEETGWSPAMTAMFAGALQYREYDFFTRKLIRLMMKRGGHPTDTSRDYEYTDWDAVDRFAEELAGRVS